MQDKYTPGPWEAMGSLVRSPMHQPEGLPRGVQIAECRDGYFLPHTPEAKANARLIAAAPELLEAMKRRVKNAEERAFEDWLARERPSGDVESVQRQWEESSDLADLQDEWASEIALIAKATGGTP